MLDNIYIKSRIYIRKKFFLICTRCTGLFSLNPPPSSIYLISWFPVTVDSEDLTENDLWFHTDNLICFYSRSDYSIKYDCQISFSPQVFVFHNYYVISPSHRSSSDELFSRGTEFIFFQFVF